MEKDICRRCGCKWNTACVDEKYGSCWWVDKNKTLCSVVIVFMDLMMNLLIQKFIIDQVMIGLRVIGDLLGKC